MPNNVPPGPGQITDVTTTTTTTRRRRLPRCQPLYIADWPRSRNPRVWTSRLNAHDRDSQPRHEPPWPDLASCQLTRPFRTWHCLCPSGSSLQKPYPAPVERHLVAYRDWSIASPRMVKTAKRPASGSCFSLPNILPRAQRILRRIRHFRVYCTIHHSRYLHHGRVV